jgi:hypothetical protein
MAIYNDGAKCVRLSGNDIFSGPNSANFEVGDTESDDGIKIIYTGG